MTAIDAVTLEVADPTAANAFYKSAFDLGDRVRVREAEQPSSGFRGFTLSIIVSQPSMVDSFAASGLEAGATELKAVEKSFWGYGGVLQAPDGTIWQIASSSKKNTGPDTRKIDDLVLLFGVSDVKATKKFYVDHGLPVAKSFGSKYVEFEAPESSVKLSLYKHDALAKVAGVSPDGTGSHRIAVHSDAGAFIDPDGFTWESTT